MMKAISGIMLSASVAGCASTTSVQTVQPVTSGPIETRAEFVATLVGPGLMGGGRNYIQYMPDGYLWGEIGGKAIVGAWEWRGDTHCQTSEPPIATGCQKWFVEGENATAVSTQGDGQKGVFRISR